MNTDQIKNTAQNAKEEAKPWVVALARCGYAAKGIVYLLIGVLALQAALGPGGKTTNTNGALHTIAGEPFGKVLLGLVGIGLCGYALWRFVQAGVDPENKGTDAKGIATRIGYAFSGLAYGALALTAFNIISGSTSGGGSSRQAQTAQLMSAPFGRWLVGLVGVGFFGAALFAFYVAYSAKFRDKLKLSEMNSTTETWITRLGRLGYAARGVVFTITGWFFTQAALHANPSETGGLDKALQTLAHQPYGHWLLGIVAIGVAAYGIYMLVQARYRRIYIS